MNAAFPFGCSNGGYSDSRICCHRFQCRFVMCFYQYDLVENKIGAKSNQRLDVMYMRILYYI